MKLSRYLVLIGGLTVAAFPLTTTGQNLVINPGFEQYTFCRDSTASRILTAGGLNTYIYTGPTQVAGTGAPGWLSPTSIGAAHFLPCNTFPTIRDIGSRYTGWYRPNTGVGYLILHTYSANSTTNAYDRSYAQGQLTRPLVAGCTYRVSCWARVARTNEGPVFPPPVPVASDNLGAYFTRARFGTASATVLTGFQPQAMLLPAGRLLTDTLNYTYLSSTFVAQGGEQFFTLGNFQPNAATTVRPIRPTSYPLWAGYAIDDVAVEALLPPGLALDLGPDQWLGSCAGSGPATLTAPPGFQSYRWNTGQTTASIQVSQPGRYVVTADFGCGVLKDSLEVRRYDPRLSPPLLPPPPALCPTQSLTLSAVPGFSAYQWSDGPTGPTRPVTQPGRYRLTARTADGCLVRDSVEVALLPPPTIPAGFPPDTLICEQEAWRLTVPAPPAGISYQWSTGSTNATLYVPPGAAGSYSLTVRNSCQAVTATVQVRTQDCTALLKIPNVITPNGDGRNDQFRVVAPGVHRLHLQVFNRWGQLLFEAADYQHQWPTGPQAAGSYYYLLLDETYGRRYRGWLEVLR
ncbi:MAG: Gliding motility-associated C-terminal protein [Hymenobacter sp.]|nr:Gliding motility-associated C-terminal protein [Hymenobacter sp.]